MENNLQKMRPALVGEWSERNLPLTPETISYGSNRVVWWKAVCGHEWTASVKARSSGEKCPICSGARVVVGVNDLATSHPEISEQWAGCNEIQPTEVSAGSHKKIVWHGKCGHEWMATVKSRVQGSGCPYCSHNLVLKGFNDLESRFPDIAAEWSPKNLPLTPDTVTAFKNSKAWWRCSHGHEWYTLISTRSGGSKCPYCSGIQLLKGFNDLATTNPDLAAEWSDKNGMLQPDDINEKSRLNVWWKCRSCGYEWKSVVRARVRGIKCPVCADRKVLAGFNDLATTDKALVNAEWNFERNEILPTQVSRNSWQVVWWKCGCGNSWRGKISERVHNETSCPECAKSFITALPQLLVMLYCNKNELRVVSNTDQVIGFRLESYIPEFKMAIEVESDKVTERRYQEVKAHICNCNGVTYVLMKRSNHPEKIARLVVAAFAKVHIYFRTDIEADIAMLKERYLIWRKAE